MTEIEWTDYTWNPATGCNMVSPGCANCYAEALTRRFPTAWPEGFEFTLHPSRLEKPYRLRKPRRIFVNSMSDLFHECMPTDYLKAIFKVMESTPQHQYQVLTKRSGRLAELAKELPWSPNVWMGVSVELQQYAGRIDDLRHVPAAIRFLSCEPLLGPLDIDLTDIHWVIVGGESGPKHRPMNYHWVSNIRDQCQAQGVAFFFKQWGGRTSKSNSRVLDGRTWDEYPR